jgi:hypothetical protein
MTDEMLLNIWKMEKAAEFYNLLGNLAGYFKMVKMRDWLWEKADIKEEKIWNILFYRGV